MKNEVLVILTDQLHFKEGLDCCGSETCQIKGHHSGRTVEYFKQNKTVMPETNDAFRWNLLMYMEKLCK